MEKVGFIGVGAMGRPMAVNLLQKGYEVTVFDVVPERIGALAQAGARTAASAKEAAGKKDVVITMLPSSPHVEAAVTGKNGILEGISPGTIYLDMSTIDPVMTKKIAAAVAEKGIPMLDCPVSGGVKGAVSGNLSIYVGGESQILEKVRELLATMGKNIVYMGAIGAGSMTKLVNQLCMASICGATLEALVMGAKAGIDVDKLVEAVAGGSGGSQVLNRQIKEYVLKRRFEEVNFPVDLLLKDLDLSMTTAKSMNIPLLYGSLSLGLYTMLKAKGLGKGFFPEVSAIFEEFAGVELKGRS